MRPRFFPTLVNGRCGDPALYVDFVFERRAMLFDLGDLHALAPRKALRVTEVFVSHAHMDHFIGFDQLLRLMVGRDKRIRLWGPAGFLGRLAAKLGGYTWNLSERFRDDLVLEATEVGDARAGRRARFRLRAGFAPENIGEVAIAAGVLLDEPSLRVRCAVLEHGTPCLGFALEEKAHVNVWRNRLAELGLDVGPWLAGLKAAVHAGQPDDTPVPVAWRDGRAGTPALPLGLLRRAVLSVTPGQKIGYVTDVAPGPRNAQAIMELVRGADVLFIEAAFARADARAARARRHLTTADAGTLAGAAGAHRLEPFHFSARYLGQETRMLREVEETFRSAAGSGGPPSVTSARATRDGASSASPPFSD